MDRSKRLLKTVQKKASFLSAFSGILVRTVGENVSKSAFSCENDLVWTGENKPKSLMWTKISFFVFVETNTDTFKKRISVVAV